MYVLVRRDLPPAQICVQAAHAAIESTKHAPFDGEHPHLMIAQVDSETKLKNCMERLRREGVECYPFYEPDIGNQLTAVATRVMKGAERELCKRFQCLKL